MKKKLVVASNMYNEIEQLPEWFEFVHEIADGGMLIVDTGSTDGTIEYATEQGAIVILDDIIRREGYGPARNHLRTESKKYFPDAHWMIYLDADERLDLEDFHQLRFIKEYLIDDYDVVAFPRIDWVDKERTGMAKDYHINPDWQARMTRLDSPLQYVRILHEQIMGHKQIYCNLTTPKINHFHRSTSQEKRDEIGKLCSKLHAEDHEFGTTYPQHHKEVMYYERYLKEGLK
jgi:glycosyltransferase involved in cell wall biosynthesis